jgi:hypothetical protein
MQVDPEVEDENMDLGGNPFELEHLSIVIHCYRLAKAKFSRGLGPSLPPPLQFPLAQAPAWSSETDALVSAWISSTKRAAPS